MTMILGKTKAVPTLPVTDLKRAKEFYESVLELEGVQSPYLGEGDAAYKVGGDSYIYIYERPEPSHSTATAFAFAVEDFDDAVNSLRERGVQFEEYDIPEIGLKTVDGVAEMGEVKSAWFRDPSGNILAIDNALPAFMQ
jgi:catechol 2,3-dioxygenase-like lactoylglutathione lyase family enzyme